MKINIHMFDSEFAIMYGIDCAVILHELERYINCGKPNSKVYHGKRWEEIDTETFKLLFPYLSEHKIKKALATLIFNGLIVMDNFGGLTLWYAISDKGVETLKGK